MPRNVRKFKQYKVMQMFNFDTFRDDIFPNLLTPAQRKQYEMDDFTRGVAKEWIKTRTEDAKEDCACGNPE